MFKVGQQVRSLDPRDSLGDLFTIEEAGIRHSTGPVAKIRRGDEVVYRLERDLRTNETVSASVQKLLDAARGQGS